MFSSMFRRILLFVGVIIILLAGIFGYSYTTFSSQELIKQHLENKGLNDLAEQPFTTSGFLNTVVTWPQVTVSNEQLFFYAETLTAEINFFTSALGNLQLKAITIEAPVFEMRDIVFDVKYLDRVLTLDTQRIDLSNGWLVTEGAEILDIELIMLRTGAFAEYSTQTKGRWVNETGEVSFNYSGILSKDRNAMLAINRSELTAQAQLKDWQGALVARLRGFTLDENDNITLDFASWSSNWRADKPYLNGPLDFAGGIDNARGTLSDLRFGSIEAALAYRDKNQWAHTVSAQAVHAKRTGSVLTGELGFTVLTEKPETVSAEDWQSFNFVIYGEIQDNKPFLNWLNPKIRLAYFNGLDQRISHNLDTRKLRLDPEQGRWAMESGLWVEYLDEAVTGDFGFAALEGTWPDLTIDSGPTIAQDLQPALNLLINDMEFLRALFADLVQ